jgi:hypothetical protein
MSIPRAKEILMKIVKAATVQLSPVLYSREGTVEKAARKIQELGGKRVQFATFPETVVPYYPYFSFVQTPLQNIAGSEHRKLPRSDGDGPVCVHRGHQRSCPAAGLPEPGGGRPMTAERPKMGGMILVTLITLDAPRP